MILKSDLASMQVILTKEGGEGSALLPGILQSLSVNGEVLVDAPGGPGGVKSVRGLKQKTVAMGLLVMGDHKENAYAKLEALEKMFQEANEGIPQLYDISCPHLKARKINKLLFQSFSSSESGSEDAVRVYLGFEEFIEAEREDEVD